MDKTHDAKRKEGRIVRPLKSASCRLSYYTLFPTIALVPDFLKMQLEERREYVEFDIALEVISEDPMIQDKGKETLAEGL